VREVSARVLGVALALGVSLVAATPAAACGELHHARASGHAAAGRAPLVIGDSTLIFAAPVLGSIGLEADARGCRQFSEGVAMLAARRRAGRLPGVAVMALGANGPIGTSALEAALRVTGRERVLALVTPRNLGSSAGAMRVAAARHPHRVLLVDWARTSAGHGGWFAGDGLHVTNAGARIYARFIRRAVAPFAFPPVRRLGLPRTTRGARACDTVRASGRRLRVFVVRGAVACGVARRTARRPLLHPSPGWNCFDWRHTGAGPWRSVLKRPRRPDVVATTAT
jgi:hypothetical protein